MKKFLKYIGRWILIAMKKLFVAVMKMVIWVLFIPFYKQLKFFTIPIIVFTILGIGMILLKR